MAKKLSDIKAIVDSAAIPFLDYLHSQFDAEIYDYIEKLNNHTQVYIFSGVIRNYFLKINENRDVDLVLASPINLEEVFTNTELKRNSFGGYKIKLQNTIIDLWYLENTWAFQHQKILDSNLEQYIPDTAFFNFSSIVYSFTEKRFHYTSHFLRFLRDKKIDVVFKPNLNYSLCIVNTFYYSKKYKLKIADNLKRHIKYLHKTSNKNHEPTQIKHFGSILYNNQELDEMINSL